MRLGLVLGVLMLSGVSGCAEKVADTGSSPPPAPTSTPESKAVSRLTLPEFVLIDRSEETHRKFKTEDLKETLAYLGVPVGLEGGGRYTEIATAETLLIFRRTEVFTTAGEGQQTFRLALVAGASPDGKRQRKTAQIEITGVPPLKAGSARIEVSVQIGGIPPTKICGDVAVWAKETTTGTDLLVRRVD